MWFHRKLQLVQGIILLQTFFFLGIFLEWGNIFFLEGVFIQFKFTYKCLSIFSQLNVLLLFKIYMLLFVEVFLCLSYHLWVIMCTARGFHSNHSTWVSTQTAFLQQCKNQSGTRCSPSWIRLVTTCSSPTLTTFQPFLFSWFWGVNNITDVAQQFVAAQIVHKIILYSSFL